jgi:acetate kinase
MAISTRDHAEGIAATLAALAQAGHPLAGLKAAAHRIVHGGTMTDPCRLTPDTLARVQGATPLAPLHNPPALAGVAALTAAAPDLPQFASFDTAFHAGQPAEATTYALPADLRDRGFRRYGFHGLSYAGLTQALRADLPARLLAFHLGAGVSLCAIHNGRSVATSMGYSPLSGPPMATRAGDIDAGLVLRLVREIGAEETEALLNRRSGLQGLAGTSDMRALLADPASEARFAVDHFCYWVARQAGSLMTAMGGVDAWAFTGGIGENAPEIRTRILSHLSWLGERPIHIVKAEEERQIARDAITLIRSAP